MACSLGWEIEFCDSSLQGAARLCLDHCDVAKSKFSTSAVTFCIKVAYFLLCTGSTELRALYPVLEEGADRLNVICRPPERGQRCVGGKALVLWKGQQVQEAPAKFGLICMRHSATPISSLWLGIKKHEYQYCYLKVAVLVKNPKNRILEVDIKCYTSRKRIKSCVSCENLS